jgi:hypothetical protein
VELRKVENHSSSSDGSFESVLGSDGIVTSSSSSEEPPFASEDESSSGDSVKSESVASMAAKWEQPPAVHPKRLERNIRRSHPRMSAALLLLSAVHRWEALLLQSLVAACCQAWQMKFRR